MEGEGAYNIGVETLTPFPLDKGRAGDGINYLRKSLEWVHGHSKSQDIIYLFRSGIIKRDIDNPVSTTTAVHPMKFWILLFTY